MKARTRIKFFQVVAIISLLGLGGLAYFTSNLAERERTIERIVNMDACSAGREDTRACRAQTCRRLRSVIRRSAAKRFSRSLNCARIEGVPIREPRPAAAGSGRGPPSGGGSGSGKGKSKGGGGLRPQPAPPAPVDVGKPGKGKGRDKSSKPGKGKGRSKPGKSTSGKSKGKRGR